MRGLKLRKSNQKGFTLLELLVVVTLLAILATGALLAYDGLTDSAQGTAAANNIATADQSIRNYRAVTGNLPNQWDHLVTDDTAGGGGAPLDFVSPATYSFLGGVTGISAPTQAAIIRSFANVNVEEFQVRTLSGLTPGVEPNLLHNEGAVQLAGHRGDTLELEIEVEDNGNVEAFFNTLVVVPAGRSTDEGVTHSICQIGGQAITGIGGTAIDATGAARAANFLNKINDKFEDGECHLVAAFGFGNDAAKSTTGSAVAIASAPTYVSNVINPASTYARYIALFHLGSADGPNVTDANILRKPVLVGVIDPEGKLIDQNIAVASTAAAQQ